MPWFFDFGHVALSTCQLWPDTIVTGSARFPLALGLLRGAAALWINCAKEKPRLSAVNSSNV
jgi:hypothetical protein